VVLEKCITSNSYTIKNGNVAKMYYVYNVTTTSEPLAVRLC